MTFTAFDKPQATINDESEDSTANGTLQEVELPRIGDLSFYKDAFAFPVFAHKK
jgi:hypothetical protein